MNTLFTLPPVLTTKQSLILETVRVHGQATAIDAGHELHAQNDCQHCRFGDPVRPLPVCRAEWAGGVGGAA